MRTYTFGLLTALATMIAANAAAAPAYLYTEVRFPGATQTSARSLSGTNLVGYYTDASNNIFGFIYNGGSWTNSAAWTSFAAPASQGTEILCISDTNLVGAFADTNGNVHGFLYNGSAWTTLDYPGTTPGSTTPWGVSGANVVGAYVDASGVNHGFLYNIGSSNWTALSRPGAGSASGQGTRAFGICGSNIVGEYYDSENNQDGFLYDMSSNQWTTLNDPAETQYGSGVVGISGTNILGSYFDNSGAHGFIHPLGTISWINKLDDPIAPIGFYPNAGTFPRAIEGTTFVGDWYNDNGTTHGFLATPIPSLSASQSNGKLALSWPYSPFVTWTLQQNPDLTTTNWTPAPTNAISNDGTNNFMSITPSTGNLFFRLSQ